MVGPAPGDLNQAIERVAEPLGHWPRREGKDMSVRQGKEEGEEGGGEAGEQPADVTERNRCRECRRCMSMNKNGEVQVAAAGQ